MFTQVSERLDTFMKILVIGNTGNDPIPELEDFMEGNCEIANGLEEALDLLEKSGEEKFIIVVDNGNSTFYSLLEKLKDDTAVFKVLLMNAKSQYYMVADNNLNVSVIAG